MKTIACAAFALTLLSGHAMGADLKDLIRQNVQDATTGYSKSLAPKKETESIRLWIHVRKDAQRRIAEEIQARLTRARLGEKIKKEPVQVVRVGPSRTQLRFFKAEDKAQARELSRELQKMLPHVDLKDLSREYARMTWIKPGHYELWLDPRLARLKE